MENHVGLQVYRRLDNRLRGELDDSPFALELHERRRRALEDAFGTGDDIRVVDWGLTKDTQSHELVELLVAGATLTFKYAIVPGLQRLGEKLIDLGAETTTSELVKAIVSRLRPKQQARELSDFIITLPDRTSIHVQPPDQGSTITVSTLGGPAITIESQPKPD